MKIFKYVISAGIGLLTALACYVTIGKDRSDENQGQMNPNPRPNQYPGPSGYQGNPNQGPMGPMMNPQEGAPDPNQPGMQAGPSMQGSPSMGPMDPNACQYQLNNMGMMNPSDMIPNQGYPNPGYGNTRRSNNLVSRLDKIQVTLVNFARFVSEIVRAVSFLVRSTDLAYDRISYYGTRSPY